MKWFELIFSDAPQLRYRRHIIFWILWWIYFAASYFFTQQGIEQSGSAKWIFIILTKSFLLLLCHALLVYASIYLLLPMFIKKDQWLLFTTILITSVAITIAWGYFCYAALFPFFDHLFQLPNNITKAHLFWNIITAGLLSALKVVAASVVIKILKNWWIRQKENETLEKEKIAVELLLLKAQIHPDILFSSLDKIYDYAQTGSPKASELLLKLSDLLSYILYECDQPEVSLEKELKMIKDCMILQKTGMNDQLEISITIKGDIREKKIAPLLLLPFLENSLSYCMNDHLEKTWISMDIKTEGDILIMKLVNGKSAEESLPEFPLKNGLGKVNKRLQILYPEKNELRIHAEPEVMMTFLKLDLGSMVHKNEIVVSEKSLWQTVKQ